LLAVGNVNVGPAPPDELRRPHRGEEERRVDVAQPEGVIDARSERWQVDDGHDDPRDEVPVVAQVDRDHRLDV
jgi:hypothetical protein